MLSLFPGDLFICGGNNDYLQMFLRAISSHAREALKATLGILGELVLFSITHDKWNTELKCSIKSCSAGVGAMWPVG